MRRVFIRSNKPEGEATLYTEINLRRAGFHAIVPIGVSVDVTKWHKAMDNWGVYADTYKRVKEENAKIKKVEKIQSIIDDAIEEMSFDEDGRKTIADIPSEEVKERLHKAIKSILDEDIRLAKALQREEEKRKEEAERIARAQENADVRRYLASLIEGMREGKLTIKSGNKSGERYTPNTIKMWTNLQGVIERFYRCHPFTWESIDESFAATFREWLEEEEGYMRQTVKRYIGEMVALINRAYKDRLHQNIIAASYFTKPRVDEAQKAAEIYLTADELNALYQMPLTGENALVRDIFIVGCCTCQRVSDYSRLKKENFVTTARGAKVVKIQQQKTQNFVTIPILDDKLTAIMEKYGYNLPQLPASFDVILNRKIKEICKELAESVPSLNDELPTILTMKERAKEARGEVTFKRDKTGRVVKPRYELVTSHTARRTGITNLYLTGRFDIYQMMHVSGHKEAKTFREYIKLSGDEMAEQIAEKMGNDNLF